MHGITIEALPEVKVRSGLDSNAILLWLVLKARADRLKITGVELTTKAVGELSGLSRVTAHRALSALETAGFITVLPSMISGSKRAHRKRIEINDLPDTTLPKEPVVRKPRNIAAERERHLNALSQLIFTGSNA